MNKKIDDRCVVCGKAAKHLSNGVFSIGKNKVQLVCAF